jgi:hypothetical protein
MSDGDSLILTLMLLGAFFVIPTLVGVSLTAGKGPGKPRDLCPFVHVVIFSNSKVKSRATYKVVYKGKDITPTFATEIDPRTGCGVTVHLDWESKYHFGVAIRRRQAEPLFWHRVNLEGDDPKSRKGYGGIETVWHDKAPTAIYDELLETSRPDYKD